MEQQELSKIEQAVEKCHRQLKKCPRLVKYLNDRLINNDLIDYFKLGYGKFYGSLWLVIPVYDAKKQVRYFKLRRDPNDTSNKCKFKFYPPSTEAGIYGIDTLLESKMIFITEGEFDRIVAFGKGIPAITTTAGASGFKREWIDLFKRVGTKQIYICFDNDKAGLTGSEKLGQAILEEMDFVEVYYTVLPQAVGEGGDLTDYFKLFPDGIDDLVYNYSVRATKKPKQEEIKKIKNSNSSNYSGGDITDADIEEAKKANCADFYSPIARTDPSGKAWINCPFHKEKTPSCCLYPDGQGWYCYGCGQGGDAISFVQNLNNLGFIEAVKYILKKG